MANRYTNIMRLLLGPAKPFREQMSDLDPDTIRDVLGSRPQPKFEQEDYFMLVGRRTGDLITCEAIGHESQGNPGMVEFSWEDCLKRQQEQGDVIGWFHTHPPGAHGMSGMDANTFQSWLVTIGGPRYAVIVCEGIVHCWELYLRGIHLGFHKVHCTIEEDGSILIYPEHRLPDGH